MDSYFAEKTVETYLEKNLPPTDERIPQPMHPDCEVCVVIPCYAERKYILRPLLSLIRQKWVNPQQFEVIVVVNNPGEPPGKDQQHSDEAYKQKLEHWQEVLNNNRETLKLLQYINNQTLRLQLQPQEEQSAAQIRQWGLRVYSVDKSSQGKILPPAQANVGGARNRGTAEAIARFYKQAGRNGIIAHTDADTSFDEYYIYNLIKAFKENPRLVGLAGVDEVMLEDPWNRQMMKHLLWGHTNEVYLAQLHQLFFSDPQKSPVLFLGCNMNGLAFETAMAGGIPTKTGAEDTHLGWELSRIGVTARGPEVVNFHLLRYSSRTTTGEGLRMNKARDDENTTGQINVRSMDSAFYLGAIYKRLQEARKNKQTSIQALRSLLSFGKETILNEEDLTSLSRNLDQLDTCWLEYLPHHLREVMTKLCERIDQFLKPLPITKAFPQLLKTYFQVEGMEKEFHMVKTEMTRERKETLAALESIIDTIFSPPYPRQDPQIPVDRLTTLLQTHQTPLLAREFLGKKYRVRRIAELLALAGTKEEALELISINYMLYLFLPGEDPVLSIFFDLCALGTAFGKYKRKINHE